MNGCGELQVGGEAKRLAPELVARLSHPLIAKSALGIRPPHPVPCRYSSRVVEDEKRSFIHNQLSRHNII